VLQERNLNEENCFENTDIIRMWGNTNVRTFYKLFLRVFVSENVHWADYFCCGTATV
jgi:hypothetical protein